MTYDIPIRPSPNFTWAEVHRSATATARQLDNTLPNHLIPNVLVMAARMEWVRALLGDQPVTVTSWYRSPAVNTAVGSGGYSVHPHGLAVDFRVLGMTVKEAYDKLRKSAIPFDQLIIETNQAGSEWIHMGCFVVPRRQSMVAWWDRTLKRMVYRREAES